MAVNRGGFLWTGEWPRPETAAGAETAGDRNGFGGETGLYYRDIPYWEKYTAVSFFFLDERPSVLLSRDDFFSEPSVPVPGSRIWSVNMYSGEPLETGNVFADFPPDAGWDIDALRPGGGGYWYYRAALKNSERPQYHYFHTAALFEKGEEISAARFRSAAEALPPAEAPAPLALLLETAALYAGETARASGAAVPAASVLMTAPGFPAARAFSLSGGAGASLFGFYRPGEIPLAFAFSPEGKGCRLMNGTAEAYSLPSLPEGFVYTGAGADGNTLFASWEEQRDYNIGAAGFMAIRLP
jgi:hypothetical protein